MEEQKNNQPVGQQTCGCGCIMCRGKIVEKGLGCDFHHNCSYHLIRWILISIILAAVFCSGIIIGEFKGMFGEEGYGLRNNRYYQNYQMVPSYYQQSFPMMQQGQSSSGSVPVNPKSSGATAPAQK